MHTDCINERGVSASVYEYAKNLMTLGHTPEWYYDGLSHANNNQSIDHFSKEIQITPYKKFELVSKGAARNFDMAYFQKAGQKDIHVIPDIPNAIHAVFNIYDKHGDYYAYISEWLAKAATRIRSAPLRSVRRRIQNPFSQLEYVPYLVDLPEVEDDARRELGVPEDAFVAMTMGGKQSFDIPWVKKTISSLIEESKDFYFLAVNTEKFIEHPRAIFVPATSEKRRKVQLLNTGNVFIHARTLGESFGMALLEAMRTKIPILSWGNGLDRNHMKMLDKECLYLNSKDLIQGVAKIRSGLFSESVRVNFVRSLEYSAENVMKRFCEVFKIS